MQIDYFVNGKPKSELVELKALSSNLPNGGKVWFMICPVSGIMCRKIFFNGELFVYRKLLKGIYSSQDGSHKNRTLDQIVNSVIKLKALHNELIEGKKYSKKEYKGKITRPHLKKLAQLKRARYYCSLSIFQYL